MSKVTLSGPARAYQDERFSYVVLRRGARTGTSDSRPRVGIIPPETVSSPDSWQAAQAQMSPEGEEPEGLVGGHLEGEGMVLDGESGTGTVAESGDGTENLSLAGADSGPEPDEEAGPDVGCESDADGIEDGGPVGEHGVTDAGSENPHGSSFTVLSATGKDITESFEGRARALREMDSSMARWAQGRAQAALCSTQRAPGDLSTAYQA